jgi:hypothetical protein
MTTYRAKLIVERVEVNRPIIRGGTDTSKERIYDEIRIEVTGPNADVALSKVINLANAEQADRDARAMMPAPVPVVESKPKQAFSEIDEEDDEDDV